MKSKKNIIKKGSKISFAHILLIAIVGISTISALNNNNNNATDKNSLSYYRRSLETSKEIKERSCADMKDVLYNIAPEDQDYGKEYRTTIREGWIKENTIGKVIKGESIDAGTEISNFIPILMPYIIFMVFSLFGFFIYCYCCCCPDSCCPPCKCCSDSEGKCCGIQCDQREPFKGLQLLVPFALMQASFLYLAIVSIIGIANAGDMEEGFKAIKCAVIDSIYSLNYGANNWMGIQGFSTSLSGFAENVRGDYKTGVVNTFSADVNWANASKAQMDSEIDIMNTQFDANVVEKVEESSVINYKYQLDPNYEAINSDSTNPKQYSCFFSQFVEPTLCDYSQKTAVKWTGITEAMTKIVDGAVQATIDSIISVNAAGSDIASDIDTFANDIDSGASEVNDIKVQMDDVIKDMDSNLGDVEDIIENMITPNITAIFVVFLIFSILLATGASLMLAFKFYKFRICLHLCWAFFIILAFFLFIFSSVFLTVSVAGSQVCDFLYTSLNDKAEFNSINMDESAKEKLAVCKKSLDGDGNILETFGIRDQLKQIDSLNDNLSSHLVLVDENKSAMKELTDQLALTEIYLEQLENTAAVEEVWDNFNYIMVEQILETANPAWTWSNNKDSQKCKNANDCKDWNDVTKFTVADGAYTTVNGAGQLDALLEWRNSKNTLVNQKLGQNSAFKTEFNIFKDQQDAYTQSLKDFQLSTGAITDKLTNTETGILADGITNCLFIGQNLDQIYDGMCVVFFPNWYGFTKIMGTLSFGLFFSSFFMFCTALRFSKNSKLNEFNKVGVEGGEKMAAAAGVGIAGGVVLEDQMQQQQNEYPQEEQQYNNNNDANSQVQMIQDQDQNQDQVDQEQEQEYAKQDYPEY